MAELSARGRLAETWRLYRFLVGLLGEVGSLPEAKSEGVLRKFGVDCVALPNLSSHQDPTQIAEPAEDHAKRLLMGCSAAQTGPGPL